MRGAQQVLAVLLAVAGCIAGAGGECGPPCTVCVDGSGTASCVDLDADGLNCGRCGRACPLAQSCALGECQPVALCDAIGMVDCGGACVDVWSDPSHCGGCWRGCGCGEACLAGGCVEVGLTCLDAELSPCGGECVDLGRDARNCGACGVTCPTGCYGGLCS